MTRADDDTAAGPVDDIEAAISSLINPFLAKTPIEKPLPRPIVVPPTVEPSPVPPAVPIIEPEPPPIPVMPPVIGPGDIGDSTGRGDTGASAVKVTGIIYNSKRPQAIINGQLVDVGQTFGDQGKMKLLAVEKGSIKFLSRGQEHTQTLNQGNGQGKSENLLATGIYQPTGSR
ncbi:MAG: hypothetical protein HQL16_00470 [Candidatus Omnitrophica bacterium]|nr:hypothetical protein [Candidatus Omnitrophota bacterium]